jgi:hypothetical protein
MSQMGVDLEKSAVWELWYADHFDLEASRRLEIQGEGLVKGLELLWQRHLHETIRESGSPGFSHFNIWWKQAQRSIDLPQDHSGLAKIRGWVLKSLIFNMDTQVVHWDWDLLKKLATTHCQLIINGQSVDLILVAAEQSQNYADFFKKLEDMCD